jgi:hypothetical protein
VDATYLIADEIAEHEISCRRDDEVDERCNDLGHAVQLRETENKTKHIRRPS